MRGGTWVGWVWLQRRQHREGLPDPTPPHPTHTSPGPGKPPPSLERRTRWSGSWTPTGAGGDQARRRAGSQASGQGKLPPQKFVSPKPWGGRREACGGIGGPARGGPGQPPGHRLPARPWALASPRARRGWLPRWTLLRLAHGPVDPGWIVPQRGHSRGHTIHADGAGAGHAVGTLYHIQACSVKPFLQKGLRSTI